MADGTARSALVEWMAVGVLLLGCALATVGVMTFSVDGRLGWLFIGVGAVVALLGAVGWTVIVKTRDPSPRAARREL